MHRVRRLERDDPNRPAADARRCRRGVGRHIQRAAGDFRAEHRRLDHELAARRTDLEHGRALIEDDVCVVAAPCTAGKLEARLRSNCNGVLTARQHRPCPRPALDQAPRAQHRSTHEGDRAHALWRLLEHLTNGIHDHPLRRANGRRRLTCRLVRQVEDKLDGRQSIAVGVAQCARDQDPYSDNRRSRDRAEHRVPSVSAHLRPSLLFFVSPAAEPPVVLLQRTGP